MKCRAEYGHVKKSKVQCNTSVTIHRVSASNIYVFTLEVDIVVDPCSRIISFLEPNQTSDVILEMIVVEICNKTLVRLK